MTRSAPALLGLILILIGACAPSRDDLPATDDDDDGTGGDAEATWESLGPGACDVQPDNPGAILPEGAGWGTQGLWYELRCTWTGGNASQITMQFEWFDPRQGGDFALTSIDVRDVGGGFVGVDGDFGALHVLPGDDELLNGWWRGDLRGVDPAGVPVRIELIVFRDAPLDTVLGR